MSVCSYLKLPFSFDIAKLKRDLALATQSPWISHFNTRAYENDWACIPLRSVGGAIEHILPIESEDFQDTEILKQCTYFQEVIAQFACEKTSIRLMSLAAGGVIKEHRDVGACLEDGITRLHIPIQTSAQVLFLIDHEPVHFSAGDTWYLNASCLHGVRNDSQQARIHLMMDCVSNDWLQDLFSLAGWCARPPSLYGDPTIHDDNVIEVIARLREAAHPTGLSLADKLEGIYLNSREHIARKH
ncbi:aspartyl/asparaginyl beta-hydroxylase domain-containing protein [Undibacterium sp. Di24W]|uniref:aspartyl/asparaginyl beta-hydroxylase domain-containing protein n=1 Tax=Undibacterium sp. Di24W TaxID=3413033 RepID=UPI003BF16324